MNCQHIEDGWCLECVKQIQHQLDAVYKIVISEWPAGGFMVLQAFLTEDELGRNPERWYPEYGSASNAVIEAIAAKILESKQ
jgi:hypothetical protein